MRAAVARIGGGRGGPVPFRLAVHLVAARYGTTPARVRAWPADDFADALNMLEATAPWRPRREQ